MKVGVVFVFLSTFDDDPHNVPPVVEGYRWLANHHPQLAVEVPAMTPDEKFQSLIDELKHRAIIEVAK